MADATRKAHCKSSTMKRRFALRFGAISKARLRCADQQPRREGLQQCLSQNPDMVFLDVRLGDADGLDILAQIRQERPQLPVVVMTAYGTLETVNRAMASQVFDYVTKPVDMSQAEQLVLQALASTSAASAAPAAPAPAAAEGFVGESAVMQELFKQLLRVAAMDEAPVLITGATGTGKELAARMIHARSRRRHYLCRRELRRLAG